ncbi:Small G protein signaling modulator 1, partial [Stegodyphus mimosarum]
MEPIDASQGLTAEIWHQMHNDSRVTDSAEVYRLTYFGGVDPTIRKEVWPYLLGHYEFGSSQDEREKHNTDIQTSYETTMSEWLAVEAIVRQRDKEIMAANLAKLSSESTNSEIPLVGPKDANLSNEVFEDLSSGEYYDHPDEEDIPEVPEEEDTATDKKDEVKVTDQSSVIENTEGNVDQKADEEDSENISQKNGEKQRARLRHMQAIESQSIIITNPSVDVGNPVSPSQVHTPSENIDESVNSNSCETLLEEKTEDSAVPEESGVSSQLQEVEGSSQQQETEGSSQL